MKNIMKVKGINEIHWDFLIKLIENKKQLIDLQSKSKKNFFLTDKYISNKIDDYRKSITNSFTKNLSFFKKNALAGISIK